MGVTNGKINEKESGREAITRVVPEETMNDDETMMLNLLQAMTSLCIVVLPFIQQS